MRSILVEKIKNIYPLPDFWVLDKIEWLSDGDTKITGSFLIPETVWDEMTEKL